MRYFVTGFPGFLARQLVPRLLDTDHDAEVHCLVERRFIPDAERIRAELPEHATGRLEIIAGDIVLPDLGLAGLSQAYDEVFHLAAVYDLSVPQALAYRVNVLGTRHIVDFARSQPQLRRLHYVSTCYVSGTYRGRFRDEDLVMGQGFHNHYEATKYEAEVQVQSAMAGGLPVTIYRPAIVVGDSRTGSTSKLDGPYPLIQWMTLLPRIAVLPTVGNPREHRVNMVPSDWLVDTLFELSRSSKSLNRVYQLCDPEPPSVDEAIRVLAAATERTIIRVPLPMPVARLLMTSLGRMLPGIDLKAEMLDYFTHPAIHVASDIDSESRGVVQPCPRFADYAPAMVDFVRNGTVSSAASGEPQRKRLVQ